MEIKNIKIKKGRKLDNIWFEVLIFLLFIQIIIQTEGAMHTSSHSTKLALSCQRLFIKK